MAVYFVTFRIAEEGNSTERYQMLQAALAELANGKWWVEPTSFVLFDSGLPIEEVAKHIQAALDTSRDMALIGMPMKPDARVVGASSDPDLALFMPYAKKLR